MSAKRTDLLRGTLDLENAPGIIKIKVCGEAPWLAGKQFLNGLHGIEETIGLRKKRDEIMA
jgi:hypothetical protein